MSLVKRVACASVASAMDLRILACSGESLCPTNRKSIFTPACAVCFWTIARTSSALFPHASAPPRATTTIRLVSLPRNGYVRA